MGRPVFGTDGVRGVANAELTPEFALALGRAVGSVLGGPVVLGRDTRRSSPLLAAATAAGLASVGADVLDAGVVTTPAVAYLASTSDVRAAVMVSASHNPFEDNGLKVIGADGFKLADADELRLEEALAVGAFAAPTARGVGDIRPFPDAAARYVDHLVACGSPLGGLAVTLDCANGAATRDAPEVFRRLGADVRVRHADPDGTNINARCGSTCIDDLAGALAGSGRIGFAFDGDADRVLAVDEAGDVVDGDRILVISAVHLHGQGRLLGGAVAVTVMSNLGLHRALAAHGIGVVETPVGDRYVSEALRRRGLGLGGEQSGHIIFADAATTGDGILTAVRLAGIVAGTATPLHELAAVMQVFPQHLVNVRVRDRAVVEHDDVRGAVAAAADRLGVAGRILVRPSGTEPLVRVMVEAVSSELAAEVAGAVAATVRGVADS